MPRTTKHIVINLLFPEIKHIFQIFHVKNVDFSFMRHFNGTHSKPIMLTNFHKINYKFVQFSDSSKYFQKLDQYSESFSYSIFPIPFYMFLYLFGMIKLMLEAQVLWQNNAKIPMCWSPYLNVLFKKVNFCLFPILLFYSILW